MSGDVDPAQQPPPPSLGVVAPHVGNGHEEQRADQEQIGHGVDEEELGGGRAQHGERAASAGPITRLPLIITELRTTAPARSERCTSSGTLAWKAGVLMHCAIPMTSDTANSVQAGSRRDEAG